MRTGSCGVQQGLTAEAASIVKQAVTLAKRRGHAQVTPLHVANTMLAVTNGLLRTACLQSNSHPLQCKALELCFNVALNRLPASTSSSPILGSHHHQHHSPCPSISNALVAAFKRAQAHQRRGSIENQQQPLLAVKIELEQLIISILDDPSVSRVMREAGFSSTQVKSNVEQAVSLEICSHNNNNNNNTESMENGQSVQNDDVANVIEHLTSQRKRSVVILGECLDSVERVVRGVMDKVDKGEVGESLKGVKFVSLSLSSFEGFSKGEVQEKVEELRVLANNNNNGSHDVKGYVLYVGDLKCVFEKYLGGNEEGRGCYCGMDDMVIEIGKLIVNSSSENSNGIRFWVMGIATFQGYMRCKNNKYGCPSLEALWGLHPITIPAGNLSLSLINHSGLQNEANNKKKADNRRNWLLLEDDDEKQEATSTNKNNNNKINIIVETEVGSLHNSTSASNGTHSSTSTLPAWLQQYKNNHNNGINTNTDQNCVPVGELCKKWNSMDSSIQKQPNSCDKTLTLSTLSPSSSTSAFSYDHQHLNLPQTSHSWPVAEPTLQSYIPEKSSSNPNSTSSSDIMEMEYVSKFKELNSENLKTICNALEKKVPWQNDIIPEIASTILQCRCGMTRRKGKIRNNFASEVKEETWLFFQGVDLEAKEKIARELARLVFGSQNNFISIGLSSFASTRADRNKRSRDERSCSYIERFGDAMSRNPHRVFLVEDIEQVEYCSQLGFKRAIESGRVKDSNGEEVGLCDAIIILSCESFSSRSRACSPSSVKQKDSHQQENNNNTIATLEETSPCVSLDLNISIGDDYDDEDHLVDDDIGLLQSVDRKFVFKNVQEL